MKKIVLLMSFAFVAYWNVSIAQKTPVLAAYSIEPKGTTQQGVVVENTPKAELAAFGKSEPTGVQLKEGEERKEAIPVLAPFGQEPPKK